MLMVLPLIGGLLGLGLFAGLAVSVSYLIEPISIAGAVIITLAAFQVFDRGRMDIEVFGDEIVDTFLQAAAAALIGFAFYKGFAALLATLAFGTALVLVIGVTLFGTSFILRIGGLTIDKLLEF